MRAEGTPQRDPIHECESLVDAFSSSQFSGAPIYSAWARQRGYVFGMLRSSFQSFRMRFHSLDCSGVRIARILALYLS